MTCVAVLFAPGFEEIEAITIVDILRRAGIKTQTVGLNEKQVQGAHNMLVTTDTTLEEVYETAFDALILPGGAPGYIHLRNDKRVLDLINKMYKENRLVAAVCASPAVLSDAGILNGKNCTIYPGMQEELKKGGGQPVDDLVVVDGNVVTSQGPATSILFALEVVSILAGSSVSESVKEKTLLPLIIGNN
ncbi:MAG: DJ-1/PfpI family protein [Thermoplasmatota archaeon]